MSAQQFHEIADPGVEMDLLEHGDENRDVHARVLPEDPNHNSCAGRTIFVVVVIMIICLATLAVGIGLMVLSQCKDSNENKSAKDVCTPSEEAKRVGFFNFLEKVRGKYFELHPNAIVLDVTANIGKTKETFYAFDSSPAAIKRKTDSSRELLKQLKHKDIQIAKLTTRERKLLSQIKFYLLHVFDQPYDGDYYSGGWMMGPNFFCWQPMCSLKDEISSHLPLLAPQSVPDIYRLKEIFEAYNKTIHQYIENLKTGVKAGMVRSVHECRAGLDVFRGLYKQIDQQNESGVFHRDSFGEIVTKPEFYEKITNDTSAKWKNLTGKPVQQSIEEFMITMVGIPMKKLLRYLEYEHMHHCVPSSVSSGLANRPLSHVYVDGVPTERTTQRLPTGEPIQGNATYAKMMSYFTTTDITPEQVYEKGWKKVKKIYSQIVDIAKQVSGLNDTEVAIPNFRAHLKSQNMFFNNAPFPKEESGPDAFIHCRSVEGAEKHCPNRWKALQNWFKASREIMSLLDPKTINMFSFTGHKQTTPNCPITLNPDFNPSSAAQSYEGSDRTCSSPCKYNIPFFLENMGPLYSEWSVNAHEARPGHHTQVQGYTEHFRDSCGVVSAWLSSQMNFNAFAEGWGLYAETLIAQDTDTYEGKPLMKYGWLKWQMWRSLRLVVDTGLHSKGLTRQAALNLFDQYAWDNSDRAQKEVTRYQSGAGQATAYMIGEMTISRLRQEAKTKLGDKFDLKDFHFQVLSQGNAPLSFLISHIEQYVTCKVNTTDPGCADLVAPSSKDHSKGSSSYTSLGSTEKMLRRYPLLRRRSYA